MLSTIGTLVLFGGFTTANLELFAVLYVLGNIICELIAYIGFNLIEELNVLSFS